jgi:tetratricopeptide (TPR) repeat protein
MIEADRILEPVAPDAAPIRGLREYTDAVSLADAMRGTLAAIEQSLRLLLRADRGASEDDRMRAMSQQELPFDRLIERLRSRDRLSLELAGTIHDLRRRVDMGGSYWAPGPSDADRALEIVARLRREVQTIEDAPMREAAHQAVVDHTFVEPASEVRAARLRRRPPPLALAIGFVAIAIALVVIFLRRGDPMDEGVAAFQAGEMTEAIEHFREAVQDDEEDPTPRLYLGRVYRRLGRHAEAGDQLDRARRLAPSDPDVRRELGYLFLDLRSWQPAIQQFELAVEAEPEEEANWIGLVRAMRLGNDPRADATLARAPAAARALLTRDNDNAAQE